METKSLAIVLPCYNPQEDWVEKVLEGLRDIEGGLRGVKWFPVVINDGSGRNVSAASFEAIRKPYPGLIVVDYAENRGKGYAIRQGVRACEADVWVYTDIDFPYTAASFLKVASPLLQGESDIVAGIKSEGYYRQVPPVRRMISKGLQRMIRWFLRIPVADTQCGLKGFNRKGRDVFLRTTINRYLFDLEFLLLASREEGLGIRFQEVELREGVTFSRLRAGHLLKEGFNFIRIWLRFWR
jgi:glycosyltransferase involved in cell wall biosynthesis